jgi:hypothetical protein
MTLDTFLTTVYVLADDFLKSRGIITDSQVHPRRRGPLPALAPAEVLTLCLGAQVACRFASERDFYRAQAERLRALFPTLPHRTQFNRIARRYQALVAEFAATTGHALRRPTDTYEALDGSAVPVRNLKRRGRGWLAGIANKGFGHRLGWYFGFYALASVTPAGAITGIGFAAASAKDQPLAQDFFAARLVRHRRLPSVGVPSPFTCLYLADKGFEGAARYRLWRRLYHADVQTPPKVQNRVQWPRARHKTAAGLRQIVETVFSKLHGPFGLERERPHTLSGFAVRLYAKAAVHNCCIAINRERGKPDLTFMDLFDV